MRIWLKLNPLFHLQSKGTDKYWGQTSTEHRQALSTDKHWAQTSTEHKTPKEDKQSKQTKKQTKQTKKQTKQTKKTPQNRNVEWWADIAASQAQHVIMKHCFNAVCETELSITPNQYTDH